MINNLLMLCLVITMAVLLAKSNPSYENCHAPDNPNGKCVPIQNCNSLYSLFERKLMFEEELNLLVRSRCGSQENYVCCPQAEVNLNRTVSETTTPNFKQSTSTSPAAPTTTSKPSTNDRTPQIIISSILIPSTGIAAKKCDEYKEFAYEKIYAITGINDMQTIKVPKCAVAALPLIIDGIEANKNEYPHMALIGYEISGRTDWNCGGSLISENFVLSAGHCSEIRESVFRCGGNLYRKQDLPPEALESCSKVHRTYPAKYVRLGEHDLSQTNESTIEEFEIIQRIVHPHFKSSTKYNDIALFKLDRNVEFSVTIRPACLADKFSVPTTATAAGWGKVNNNENENGSETLMKVRLDIFSRDECANTNISQQLARGIVDEVMYCAGSRNSNRDTCAGDSGGPLQIHHDTHYCTYTVIGVTSLGSKPCGIKGVPAIYTRVYGYLNWIETIVWPNQ